MKKWKYVVYNIVVISVAAVLMALNIYGAVRFANFGGDGDGNNIDDLIGSNYFPLFDSSEDIYVIKDNKMSTDERAMVISLQGVVAKTNPSIFIEPSDSAYKEYLKIYEEKLGARLIYTYQKDDGGETAETEWDAWSLVGHFKDYIKDGGFVKFDRANDNAGVNAAATVSGAESWLSVPSTLAGKASEAGLVMKKDLTGKPDRLSLQKDIFEEYKDSLNKYLIIHQNENNMRLRDFGIQNKAFIFYTKETSAEREFRREVMNWADDNAPVLGWTDNETQFVADISKTGKFVVASDHSFNLSYLIGQKLGEIKQPYEKRIDLNNIDENKHYAAIVVSDGDNIQWVQGGFSTLTAKLQAELDFPITWTYPPLMSEVADVVNHYNYSRGAANDYFIAGVSGIGYMNPMRYPKEYLERFAAMSADAMERSDLSVITLLDGLPIVDTRLTDSLSYFSAIDSIKGGILELGNKYEGAAGRIYFSNDKPFISVRMSLWHPTDNNSKDIPLTWLEAQANKVNSYEKNIYSVNGYTVINVHPWTVTTESLSYFVSCLSEDVVLVSAEELIDMVAKNVPRQNATPKK